MPHPRCDDYDGRLPLLCEAAKHLRCVARGGEGSSIVSEAKSESEVVRDFVRGLTNEERTLLVIRDELYGGLWEEMLKDLEARLQAKPYVFKLATRIEDDIVRIRRMREFEGKHQINLKDHV